MAEHPPGTIGILSADRTRWAWSMQCLVQLQTPPDTQMNWVVGQWISSAVNEMIRGMRPEDQWLCIVPDDHLCGYDMLLRLLDHQLPIVAPFVTLRRYPYQPSMFHEREDGTYYGFTYPELAGKTGLVPVESMGGPFVVLRREVLEALGDPWFVSHPRSAINPMEDLYFFSRCRQLGFQPYVDLDLPLGHCLPAATFPQRLGDGGYGVRIWSTQDLGTMRFTVDEVPPPPYDDHAYVL